MLPSSQRSSPLMRSSAALMASRSLVMRRAAASVADSVSRMRRSSNSCSMFALVFQRLAVDADGGPLLRRQHEGADALARLDHAVGAQLRDRLAHHIAADAEFFGELLLGGQPGSRDEVAGLDLAAQKRSDAMRKRFDAADHGRTLLHAAFPYKSPGSGMRQPGLNRPAGSKAALIAV